MEFTFRRVGSSRFLYAPRHSQFLCFYDPDNKSALFWTGPSFSDGDVCLWRDPSFIGKFEGQVTNVESLRDRLEIPGELIPIIDAQGLKKNLQARPPRRKMIDASAWTGRKEKRRHRRFFVHRYVQLKKSRVLGLHVPVLSVNKDYETVFRWVTNGIGIFSVPISALFTSLINALIIGYSLHFTVALLKRLGYFVLREKQYPIPDFSNLMPRADSQTSSTISRNIYKDTGALPTSSPDNFCTLFFRTEAECSVVMEWLLAITGGGLDDKTKRLKLSIVVDDTFSRYFVFLVTNTANAPGENFTHYVSCDWHDRFEVPSANREEVERFIESYADDNRCSLALGAGVDGGNVRADVFLIHDFQLTMLSELKTGTPAYSQMKQYYLKFVA